MEKEFVPYEEALDLKELGFDEPCFVYWVFDGIEVTFSTSHNKSGWSMIGFKNNQMTKKAGLCTAPTYSQAFRFFREKHQLSGEVFEYTGLFACEIHKFKNINNLYEKINLLTFENAELECLKKLIEIVKKQKI
jgi:hypothetical protein